MRKSALTKPKLEAFAADAREMAEAQNESKRETTIGLAAALEELVDRRDLMSRFGAYRMLEREQAYVGACATIEAHCKQHDESLGVYSDSEFAADYEAMCKDAILYLDLRGLLDRDPETPGWFSIRNESEATL